MLATPELRFDYFGRMLTPIGLWQHSDGDAPNPRHGYSIDDEARGLIVGLRHWQRGVNPVFSAELAATCFRFIVNAALADGQYHNFCDESGCWLDPVGSEDSFGRTFWSLGVTHEIDAPFAPRADAERLMSRSLPVADRLRYHRAQAFVILGLAACRADDARLKSLADKIADAYEANADDDWHWFESQMTYENPRLPHALFLAAAIFPDETRYARIAAESLDFLLKVSRSDKGGYAPVGNAPMHTAGWFRRDNRQLPPFDQQPVDAGALVECCAAAFRVTGKTRWRRAARKVFGWYLGDNVHGLPVYNAQTGAVADAVHRDGLSINGGAESVLSFHLALQALQTME